MRVKLFTLFLLVFAISVTSYAQQRDCGAMEYLDYQKQNDPKRTGKLDQIEKHTENYVLNPAAKVVDGIITIPVVVHVVYNTTTENISDAQINSQITVLNDDFRRNNSDADNTWSQAVDTEIEFCLATVDPNGNATTGITRTQTSVTSFGTNDQVKSTSTGGVNAWPAGDYLNIWVCDISGSILGYAQFPGGNPATDGVVNDYQYFGTIGTATAPFNLGRTMTHEVGHYLNLRHIWGDGGCNVDDFVTDTPTSDAANYGCATGHTSCGTTDMVQNYMDYSDDACMNLYTAGQKTRMRAIFEPGGARESLLNSGACGNAGPPATCSDGIQNQGETGVDCGGPCAACPCAGTQVTVSITLDNYPEETSWTITNASGATVASGGTYGNQADGSTVTITNCLADGCYDFTINDLYGDGICCGYGNGSYAVTGGGLTLASGGSFASSETTNFCLGGGTTPTCNDGIQNQGETGVDCGGPCTACPTCNDGIQNQGETGVDCGGPCTACPTCNDGIQNQGETGVDCGGPCTACPTCNDGIQNQGETGVDCGGPCAPCTATPTCNDGIQNQGETGIDCGGPCAPCPCAGTEVTVSITLDNYPEETSWTITNASGTTVASGGTYGNQADGSTVTVTNCLADGCYDFTINDVYGDGICCSYGNGSYAVTGDGSTLASGGSFASSETTNFCLGGTAPTCNDGVQNQGETGVDCGGPCTACPTCNDGIQNQGETGVDCGGPCTPCGGGACSYVNIDFQNFDSGWGIWNDGGSDCYRLNSNTWAYSPSRSIRLRDNSGTGSSMTTDNIDMSAYEEATVDFTFIANSMENNEDFWLQVSNNGGSSYTTVETWARGTDFNNGTRYFESVVIAGPFASNTRFRIRCDASANADQVYIDDVNISGCVNSARLAGAGEEENFVAQNMRGQETLSSNFENTLSVYPNPTSDILNVVFEATNQSDVQLRIVDYTGKIVDVQNLTTIKGEQTVQVDASNMSVGIYFVQLVSKDTIQTKKFVVQR